MSYFMTIAGQPPDVDGLAPVALVPAASAQPYIRALEPTLVAQDGAPVFLVHDGASGTSHTLIADAEEAISRHGSLAGTILAELIRRLVADGTTFRIWWANTDPTAYAAGTVCATRDAIEEQIAHQLRAGQPVAVRFSVPMHAH